jgi:hypothetical protein
MAYPLVDGPYGLKPVNLIGGQVFAGSTREYPITYNYGTAIYAGDMVGLSRGEIVRLSLSTGTAGNQTGVFLGCSYTSPATRQKIFSTYWPASTPAGNAVAIVCDDPDAVFKAVVCSATTAVASGARAMIGQNLAMINNTGVALGGNGVSRNAILAPSDTPATTSSLPLRVLGLVPDTAVPLGTATYTSISTNTITCSALPFALPVGTDVGSLTSTGEYVSYGAFVDTAASAGATTFVLNQPPVTTSNTTIVFMQYPELLVKINFGQHQYYAGTSIA